MSEVSSGFKIGIGVILALIFVFIFIPISSCLFCGTCAALVGSTESSNDISSVNTQTITQANTLQDQQQLQPNNENLAKTSHVASFRDGILNSCIDITFSVGEGPPEKTALLLNGFEQNMLSIKKDKGQTIIKQPCQNIFNNRQVLASCVVSKSDTPGGISSLLNMKTHYYNYGTIVEDDSYMQSCIKRSGTWNAIDRTSSEWRRAKINYNLNKMNKLANDIQR